MNVLRLSGIQMLRHHLRKLVDLGLKVVGALLLDGYLSGVLVEVKYAVPLLNIQGGVKTESSVDELVFVQGLAQVL